MDLSLLQGEFDCIILGTGLIECTLSGALSKEGLRVLVLDKNDYYGGGCASLSLSQLLEKFKEKTDNDAILQKFGGPVNGTDLEKRRWLNTWNIDLIPKFIMGSGLLVRILVHTGITKYLEFQKAAGSYVYRQGKIHKVPSCATEALNSSLMGFFEKRRCAKLLQFIQNYDQANPKTHNGLDCTKLPFKAVCAKYGVDEDTTTFLGHAVALYTDESFLEKPAHEVMDRILLYNSSLANLNGGSPYLYPRYGLSELPQGFAHEVMDRILLYNSSLANLNGGSPYLYPRYGLSELPQGFAHEVMDRILLYNSSLANLKEILYDESGAAQGIKLKISDTEDHEVKCKYILGDPSYFPEKVAEAGKVMRMVCVLNAPIPNTNNAHSVQIIIPQKESGRSHDIYIICMSSMHCIVPEGKYLAIISMEVDEKESQADPHKLFGGAMRLLGPIVDSVVMPSTLYTPKSDGKADNCYISNSYDGTSHFQSAARNILDLYERMTGRELVLTSGEDQE